MTNRLRSAEMHIKLRWVGVPLLLSGIFLLITAVLYLGNPSGSWFSLLLGVASSLGALSAFGVNHDTAVSLGVEIVNSSNPHQDDSQLSEPSAFEDRASAQLLKEVELELKRNRTEALNLRPSPISAMVIPVIVVGIQLLASWRLFA